MEQPRLLRLDSKGLDILKSNFKERQEGERATEKETFLVLKNTKNSQKKKKNRHKVSTLIKSIHESDSFYSLFDSFYSSEQQSSRTAELKGFRSTSSSQNREP